MSETEKYKIVSAWATHIDTLNTKIEALSDQGYRIHTFNTEHVTDPETGMGEDRYSVLMSLNELDSKYLGVVNLEDVPPSDVDRRLADGWIIASASISTKFVRMVKKK